MVGELAPDKDHKSVFTPMNYVRQGVLQAADDRRRRALTMSIADFGPIPGTRNSIS